MKNFLTSATKKRVIYELREILSKHPKFAEDAQNVQNKFSFDERPQRGIIVTGTSADRVRLSADNYVGRLSSFLMITEKKNFPGTSIEWVRENYPLLEEYSRDRTVFPSPPGIYQVKITSLPDESAQVPGTFTISPVLSVDAEPLIFFSNSADTHAQLSRTDIYPKAVRLWLNGKRALLPDVDFSCNYETGEITFLKETPSGDFVTADYKYKIPDLGPFNFNVDSTNETAIPGAILAFGDRAQLGDQMDIRVSDAREDSCEVYGGKFETSFELTCFCRDAEERERMSDFVVAKVLEAQNRLGFEGIELVDISPGGENEDVYDENLDDYYYESSISLTLRVDWESYFSLPVDLWRFEFTSAASEQETGYLDGTSVLDLIRIGGEFLGGRRMTYESIRLG